MAESTTHAYGTVTIGDGPGSYASGDSADNRTSYQSIPEAVEGTLTIDDSIVTAWSDASKLNGAEIEIDGTPVPNLVDTIETEETLDDVVPTMSFTFADPKAALRNEGSLVIGEKPVTLVWRSGPPGAVENWTGFTGYTSAPRNTGPYRPRAVVKCTGILAPALRRTGCLRLGAFSGYLKGEVLALYALAAGVPLATGSWGTIPVLRPVDLSGVDVPSIVRRWGEAEGLRVRETDGVIEVLSELDVYRAAPRYTFTDANSFATDEEGPNEPTTKWTLSGFGISQEELQGGVTVTTTPDSGTDGEGNPWYSILVVTRDQGVELVSELTEYQTFRLGGVTPGPNVLQRRRYTKVRTTYQQMVNPSGGTPSMLYTTRIDSRSTEVYENSAIPVANATTGNNWVDANGDPAGRYDSDHARWLKTAQVEETYLWNGSEAANGIRACGLKSKTVTTYGYYSPLKPTGHVYQDGSTREAGTMVWGVVKQEQTTIQDARDNVPAELLITEDRSGYYVTGHDGDLPVETYVPYERILTRYVERGGGQQYTKQVFAARFYGNVPPITGGVESFAGTIPDPPRGSLSMPLYTEVPMQVVVEASTPYQERINAETLEHAETMEELRLCGVMRLIRELSDTYTRDTPAIPFLRVGDPVAITDPRRNLDSVIGMVTKIKRTLTVLNGRFRQTTTISVPPTYLLESAS